jgi:hypothetical protein
MNPSMSIQRRDAKEIDLTNPHVAVIDQGGLLDSELTCFDDHVPNPRELCSLSLILDALGSLEHARHTWPWLAATEIMDLRGLGAVNRAFSIPRGQLDSGGTWLAVASPLDKYLINVFGRRTVIRAGQDVHSLMRDMGAEMVSELVNSAQHFALLDHHSETWGE